jgi:hypothetical protein
MVHGLALPVVSEESEYLNVTSCSGTEGATAKSPISPKHNSNVMVVRRKCCKIANRWGVRPMWRHSRTFRLRSLGSVGDEINEVVFFLSGRWGYLAFPDGRGDLGGEEKLQEFRDTLAVFPALRAAQRTGTGTLRMRYDGGVVGP